MTAPATIHTAPVPEPVRQLRALVAAGWHPRVLWQRTGLDIPRLLSATTVGNDTVTLVADLYDHLRDTPGPDHTIRLRALALGWQPPQPRDEDDHVPEPTPTERIHAAWDTGDITTVEAITRLNALGLYDRQIGAILAMPRTSVCGMRHTHGIPRANQIWTPDRVATVARLAAEGQSDPQISRALGMSRKAVTAARIRHGIPPGHPRTRSNP
ncbi:MAG TPA: hypothetical protein VIS06_04695 [Mycobacteriales bacterium]